MSFLLTTLVLCFTLQVINGQTVDIPDANLTDLPYQKHWTNLEKKLLTTYVRSVRPVKNDSTRITVTILPFIQHIAEVNEEEQTMKVQGYLYMEWKDEFLTWDINEYNGINKITLSPYFVWRPDIMLYNSASGEEMGRPVGGYTEQIWVHNDGRIIYFPMFVLKATCLFDYSEYPYDIQQCPLILGSWSYTLRDLDVIPAVKEFVHMSLSFNDTKTVVSNWQVLQMNSAVNYWDAYNRERADTKPPETSYSVVFPEFYIWIKIKRFAPYFGAVVLMPTVMTSFFTMAAYWTRSSTAGVMLLMVNIMVQAVFTDDLIQKLPPSNGSVPRIVRYFTLNLTMTVISVVVLTLLQTISELKPDKNVPVPLKYFVYGRRFVSEKFNQRFTFVRQVDAEDDDDEDEPTNVENQQTTSHHIPDTSKVVVSWMEVGNTLKCLIFTVVLCSYILSMFILLC